MASFYIISGEQYEEYKELKKKNKPMRKLLGYDKCYLDKIIVIGVDRGYIRGGIRKNRRI